MKTRRISAAIAFTLCLVAAGISGAQSPVPTPGRDSLVGTWQVAVEGFPETRTLTVSEEGPTADGALLGARYGITGKGQGPISAKMVRSGAGRQLTFVTQADTKVAVTEQADGRFTGSFTLKNGTVHAVVISRAAAEASTPDQTVPPGAMGAPLFAVGDRWVWSARVSGADSCTVGISRDAKRVDTVTAVTGSGYIVEVIGPLEGQKYKRSLGKDLASKVTVNGESFRSDILNFPIQPGKSWDTTLFTGKVHTKLSCQAETFERLKLGGQDLEVAPIVCKGTWKNLESGNSDQAIYKYWYSPERRNLARSTVFTYSGGRTCADIEYLLE